MAYKTSQDSIKHLKDKNTPDYVFTEALRKLCFGISVFAVGFLVFSGGFILFRNIELLNIIFAFLTITCFGDWIITSCIYLPVLKKYNKGYYKKVILRNCAMILIMILIVLIMVAFYTRDISIVRYHKDIDSESDKDANITLIVESKIRRVSAFYITEDDLAGYKNGDLLLIVNSHHKPLPSDMRLSGHLSKGEMYREYIGRYLVNTNVPVIDGYIYFVPDVLFIIKLADGTEDDITFIERESEGRPVDYYD